MPALKASYRLEKIGISASVINARFIKPLDKERLLSISARIPRLITIEENVLQGGFGSAIIECLNEAELNNYKVKRLGIHDIFLEQGNPERLRAKYSLDEEGIFLTALSFMREPTFSN
jgi:1-deoxy-D-xylulose-5-phosphate synthase